MSCQTYLQQTLKPGLFQRFDIWRAFVGMVVKLKSDTTNSTFCCFRRFLYTLFNAISQYFHSIINGSQMPVLNILNQLQPFFISPVVMRGQTTVCLIMEFCLSNAILNSTCQSYNAPPKSKIIKPLPLFKYR